MRRKIIAVASLALGLAAGTGSGEELAPGAEAPRLKATTHEGKEVDLGAAFASGTTLVYFYPKALTGG